MLSIGNFWFNNYLKDRSTSVSVENNISKKNSIGYGVPQGSILDPILLGIYANDLFSHVNCFLVQYADDTQFLHSNTIDKLDHLIKYTEETLVEC